MPPFKVLITDYKWPSLAIEEQILSQLPATLMVAETGEEAELMALAPEADAILTCWAQVTEKVIDAAPRCRIITRYGVGLDNIAVEHATQSGIAVSYSPTYCLQEVAEHALALLFALARRVARFDRGLRAGDYTMTPFQGMQRIQGSTLGLVGCGNIGKTLAQKALVLGMRVLIHDQQPLQIEGIEQVDLTTLLAQSDHVSLHVPLTDATRLLVDAAFLTKMKPGSVLINTARGGLVDGDALWQALEKGTLAGAALDVYPQEPPNLTHPLFQHPHFIATPHAAFYSEQSVQNLQQMAATQVCQALSGQLPDHLVNPQWEQYRQSQRSQ